MGMPPRQRQRRRREDDGAAAEQDDEERDEDAEHQRAKGEACGRWTTRLRVLSVLFGLLLPAALLVLFCEPHREAHALLPEELRPPKPEAEARIVADGRQGAGGVIGHGGEVIRKIQIESGVLTIKGPEILLDCCLRMVLAQGHCVSITGQDSQEMS